MLDQIGPTFHITPVTGSIDPTHPIFDCVDPFANDTSPSPVPDDWRAKLSCGDVVLFVFPIRLPGDGELPKTRPCLVLDVEERGGQHYAVLAYGTSASTPANKGYEITVSTAAEITAAGLTRATRFVGARRLWTPLTHPDFRPARQGNPSPVIGHLGPVASQRMHAVRGRMHAEHDIAVERRAEARRERQRWQAQRPLAQPVVVEHRTPNAKDLASSPRTGSAQDVRTARRAGTLSLSSTSSNSRDGAAQ